MTHYKVKPFKLRNDPKVQWADYYEDGMFFVERFIMVPVGQIRFNKWNQGRYDFYMDAFKNGRPADPVRLARPWQGGDHYEVSDGNHRVAASIDMGYTHVPAIVSVKVEGQFPKGTPPKDLYEEVHGRELLMLIEFFRAHRPSGSKLYFEWGGVEPAGYWMKASDESESTFDPYEQKLTVGISGQDRMAEMPWREGRFSYRGNLDGLKRAFLGFMGRTVVAGEGGLALRIATRPIRIDRNELETCADRIVREFQRGYWVHHDQEPIGGAFAYVDSVMVEDVDGQRLDVQVQVTSARTSGIDTVIGGGSGRTQKTKRPAVLLVLNGNYSPSVFTTSCSRFRARRDIVKVLSHELTHQMDVHTKSVMPTYNRVLTEEEIDVQRYYNSPAELHAYMREVFEDIRGYLSPFLKHLSINEAISRAIKYSETWRERIAPHMTEQNRHLILKGVYQAVQDYLSQPEALAASERCDRIASRIAVVEGVAREYVAYKQGVAREYVAYKQSLDTERIQKFRRDFLTLMSNESRVGDYRTAIAWRDAIARWNRDFDDYLYKYLLHDFKNLVYNKKVPERDGKYWDKLIRDITWPFVIEFSVPISSADDYYSEESRFAQFQDKLSKWSVRVRRKAQTTWRVLQNFSDWYARDVESGTVPVVDVPAPEKIEMEGFAVTLLGHDSVKDIERYVRDFRAGLRAYKARANKVYPWLIHNQLPILMDFKGEIGTGGEYKGNYIWFNGYSASFDSVVHIMAHEMSHHRYKTFGSGERDFWSRMIRGDLGKLDLRQVVSQFPDETWIFDSKAIKAKDPLLYYQLDGLRYERDVSGDVNRISTVGDIKAYLEKGGNPVVTIHSHPISGYASKNEEEAFCEALSRLVAFGPNSVPDVVLDWLRIIMPSSRTAAMTLKLSPKGTGDINGAWKELLSKMHHLDGSFFAMSFTEGVVTLEIKTWEGAIHLAFIGVPEQYRGKGLASKALRVVTRIADKYGVKTNLDVSPQGKGGLTKKQLFDWYSRHGFRRLPYAMQQKLLSDSMERDPVK